MIEYRKENEVLVTALLNGVKIAHIEKLRDFYTVEVNYVRKRFRVKHRALITGYIKKLHYRMNKINNPPRMKESILKGKYEILD